MGRERALSDSFIDRERALSDMCVCLLRPTPITQWW